MSVGDGWLEGQSAGKIHAAFGRNSAEVRMETRQINARGPS